LLSGAGGPNLDKQPYSSESGLINYTIDGLPYGSILNEKQFPGIPGSTLSTDNIAMEALTWVKFNTAGYHCMIVNSDDGFRVTAAMCAADPNNAIVLGSFDGGRGATDSPFVFRVPGPGVYPMRLIWQQGGGGGNVEWVDIQPAHVLIDGSARVGVNGNDDIAAYRLNGISSLVISQTTSPSAGVNLSWLTGTAPCAIWRLRGTAELANPSSATVWTDLGTTGTAFSPASSGLRFFELVSP
jgi:hypothetical protein